MTRLLKEDAEFAAATLSVSISMKKEEMSEYGNMNLPGLSIG